MTPLVRAGYLAHAVSAAHRRCMEEASLIIGRALKVSARPYVSFSCGKDSVVLADLVLAQAPSTPLRFLSSGETRLLHDVDPVLDYFRRRGAIVEETNIDRVFAPEWATASWKQSRHAGSNDLQSLNADGFDCAFLGLRAQESTQRRMTLYSCRTAGFPEFIYRMSCGRLRVCPLARWRTEDIGARIVARGLPLLGAYEEEGLATRTTARLTGAAVRMGALRRLRQHHHDAYVAVIARWPELAHWQ